MADALQRMGSRTPVTSALGKTVDTLIQAFEDRRNGLTEQRIHEGAHSVTAFFVDIYEQERDRLRAEISDQQPQLSQGAREKLFDEVDGLIRRVVIPAYVRITQKFTPKERNDFYLVESPALRIAERLGWALGGVVLGYLVIRAPFVPLWADAWVLPFVVAGLLFPELRRWLSFRRYERDLNHLVARTDRELARIDRAYLTRGETIAELEQLGKE